MKTISKYAVNRLGARKMPTCRCPVVFDPRVARGFISHLLGAISGPSIARGTSFLKDRLGDEIFPEAITIMVAGNLKEIFARLVAADDLQFKTGVDSPTLRVDNLTVAGA